MPPKCEIFMGLSNHSFSQYCNLWYYPIIHFQYFDSNIGLFSIAPNKVIALPTNIGNATFNILVNFKLINVSSFMQIYVHVYIEAIKELNLE